MCVYLSMYVWVCKRVCVYVCICVYICVSHLGLVFACRNYVSSLCVNESVCRSAQMIMCSCPNVGVFMSLRIQMSICQLDHSATWIFSHVSMCLSIYASRHKCFHASMCLYVPVSRRLCVEVYTCRGISVSTYPFINVSMDYI